MGKLIKAREFDVTPAKYAQYLKEQVVWAQGILNAPCMTWGNGRSSHEVARQVICEAQETYDDLMLTDGLYTVTDTGMAFSRFATNKEISKVRGL